MREPAADPGRTLYLDRHPDGPAQFTCHHCGAKPGQPCRTPQGTTTYSHSNRFEQATAAKLLPLAPEEDP